jgi:predicted DNA-binding transcriptional regulator AlpA
MTQASYSASPIVTLNIIKLLTEQEVAALIRKSVHWLRRKRWEGGAESIPYRKLGSAVRYAESDVLNWIEQHTLQTSSCKRKEVSPE